jgi:hypothetical protein
MNAYITHSQVIQYNRETWFINSKGSGIYTHMMRGILNQVEAMLSHHNKVLLIRFDLRQPIPKDNSEHVSKFINRLSNHVKQKYKLKRFGYAWARELEKAKQQHYHCFILLDGNKVQESQYIMKAAKIYWQMYFCGSLSWVNYHRLTRNDHTALQNAIYHISYLAKGRGKGYKPAQAKNFGRSRIRPK